MIKIITDAILLFFVNIYQFFIALLSPITNTINLVVDGLTRFKNFIIPILEYTLWFFNIPVLGIAMGLTIALIGILVSEYSVKLLVKYVTRLL